jgi:polysaccharide export outer membrane protein
MSRALRLISARFAAALLCLAIALPFATGCGGRGGGQITTEPGPVNAGPAPATPPSLQEQLANSFPVSIDDLDEEYRVGPLDVIEVTIFRIPDLSGTYSLNERGWINMPPLGRVNLNGMTTEQIRATLEKLLGERYLNAPSIRIEVSDYRSRNCVVIGAVQTPGAIPISGPRTLIEVLAEAGGLLPEAQDYLLVFRNGNAGRPAPTNVRSASNRAPVSRQQAKINIQDLLQLGNPAANILVQDGDMIFVPTLGSVFIRGPVRREGEVKLTSSVRTVSHVVTVAFGLKYAAIAEGAFILRPQGSGNKLKIPVSIQEILDGDIPDVLLYNRDELVVPSSAWKAALAAVGGFINGIFNPQVGGTLNVFSPTGV